MNRIIQAILNDRTTYTNDMFENICEDFYNGVKARIEEGDYAHDYSDEGCEEGAYILADLVYSFVDNMNEHTKNMLLQKLDIPEDKLYDKILDSKYGYKALTYIEQSIASDAAEYAETFFER